MNDERRPKVFITEANSFDYSPAEAYGELVVLRGQNFAAGIDDREYNGEVIAGLRKQLIEYQPTVDFIIPTGKPLRMMVVAGLLAAFGPRHQYLIWDQKYYRYILYTINL